MTAEDDEGNPSPVNYMFHQRRIRTRPNTADESNNKNQLQDELEGYLRFCKYCLKGRVMSLFEMGSTWAGGEPVKKNRDTTTASSPLLSVMSRRRRGYFP